MMETQRTGTDAMHHARKNMVQLRFAATVFVKKEKMEVLVLQTLMASASAQRLSAVRRIAPPHQNRFVATIFAKKERLT